MAEVSQAKAARLAGVSRTTIHAKIKSGKLSQTSSKKIDTSELIRVFGSIEDSDPLENRPEPVQVNNQDGEIEYLKKRITDLETMNAELRQERERIRDEKDRLQTQVETMIEQHKPRTLLQLIGFKG
jgi:predicted nuclease with TOPRIM domain